MAVGSKDALRAPASKPSQHRRPSMRFLEACHHHRGQLMLQYRVQSRIQSRDVHEDKYSNLLPLVGEYLLQILHQHFVGSQAELVSMHSGMHVVISGFLKSFHMDVILRRGLPYYSEVCCPWSYRCTSLIMPASRPSAHAPHHPSHIAELHVRACHALTPPENASCRKLLSK